MPRPAVTTNDLRFLELVLAVVAVVAPLLSIGIPLLAWAGGDPLEWEAQVADRSLLPTSLVDGAPGVEMTWDGRATFDLAGVSAGVRLAALVPQALLMLAICGIGVALLRLVRSIRQGSPFLAGSIRSLRVISVLLVSAAVLVPLATGVADHVVLGQALEGGAAGISFDFNFVWVLVALVVRALAEVFSLGHRLADDVEGLV